MTNETATHTAGPLTIREDGEANRFHVLDNGGRWLLALLHNGEQWSATQAANMQRIAAAWNACDGIPTAELEAMDPGSFPRSLVVRSAACDEMRRAEAEADRIALAECFAALEILTDWASENAAPHRQISTACRALEANRARVNLAATAGAHSAADKRPGWVAVVRARVATYGPAAPLDDINAAQLLAEIDARV